MKKLFFMTGVLVLTFANFAFATTPTNILVNCQFRGNKLIKKCHSVTNIHIQGAADDHLLVNCPGLGTNTKVYNGDAEFSDDSDGIVINPAGADQTPFVTLPAGVFQCHQTPIRSEGMLNLPSRAPYMGAELTGICKIVTAGCGRP